MSEESKVASIGDDAEFAHLMGAYIDARQRKTGSCDVSREFNALCAHIGAWADSRPRQGDQASGISGELAAPRAPSDTQGSVQDACDLKDDLAMIVRIVNAANYGGEHIGLRKVAAALAQQAPDTARDGVRYRKVKTMTPQQLLLWRGAYGFADNVIDEMDGSAPTSPPATESALAELVLAWWDEHQHDAASNDDGEYNLYDDAPAFVNLAMQMQAVPFDGHGDVREGATGLIPCAYHAVSAEFGLVKVEECGQIKGPPLWAVRQNGNCMRKDGRWECEPSPSSRDDEFMARCRFASAQEAYAAIGGNGEGK